jgi:exodeoxyribonuclease-1
LNEVENSILWHDYETWGVSPSVDFPSQFAAIRTDLDLNIIEASPKTNLICKIPHDYLPHPQACLVTGMTPNFSLSRGLSEPEFAQRIIRLMSQANTCVAGYNSIRFDEEVTRFMLFRNLFPVYEREFKNGNSRWDIIDLVRACFALRPDGITWPRYENGKPCFKLEELTKANSLEHESAHDALSDVYATIAVAKLIKSQQPKLYNYYWQLRSKHKVNEMLQQFQSNVFVHISGFFNSQQGCCSLIMPVCEHPSNPNAVLCIDLSKPIALFTQTYNNDNVQMLCEALFARSEKNTATNDTQKHTNIRPGLMSVSANKCPFIAPIKTLSQTRANDLGIDIGACIAHYEVLKSIPDLKDLCRDVFVQQKTDSQIENIDERLYDLPFPSAQDAKQMANIRSQLPEQLAGFQGSLSTKALNELLFRYRARNYPHLLDESELIAWQDHLLARMNTPKKKGCLSMSEFIAQVDQLSTELANYPEKLKVLNALRNYANQISFA